MEVIDTVEVSLIACAIVASVGTAVLIGIDSADPLPRPKRIEWDEITDQVGRV